VPRNSLALNFGKGKTMQKELITIPEFVTLYSISRTALYREVNANRLRLVKRGRRSLISREDAAAWLANLRQGGAL
jgi:predicted DNA-binding transcriptional regulator AlpA